MRDKKLENNEKSNQNMVLLLDSNSEIGVHLMISKEVTNLIFS